MRPLRRKILSGYLAALAFASIVVGLAVYNLIRLGSASDAILRENYRSILAAEQMLNELSRQEKAALVMLEGIEPQTLAQFSDAEQNFLEWLSRAQNNVTIEGEPAILERIERGYQAFLFRLAEFRQTFDGDRESGFAYYRERLAPAADEVRQACNDLHELNRATMEESSRRARAVAHTAVATVVAGAVVALAAIVAFSLWSAERIVRPVQQLAAATDRVAAGDYDAAIQVESQDEIGRLAERFNVMVNKLRGYHQLNLRRIIGEQRKAEAILEAIDDGVLVVAEDRTIASLNPAAALILSVSRQIGGNLSVTETVPDAPLRECIEATLTTGKCPPTEPGTNLLAIPGPENQKRYFEWSLTPIPSTEKGAAGVIVLLRDVTRLKTLDQLKTEFVMTASHELRTPLTSIAMSLGLLEEQAHEKLGQNERQLLEVAHEELARLKWLVEELLDLSKIESGKLEIELAPTSIESCLRAVVPALRTQAAEKGIRLSLDVKEDLPPVAADANKIAWVAANLIGNALRYARSEICVSAERVGGWVNLYVRDDGKGIPYEQQARIFDKFVQIGGDSRGGAGLGLAIAKEIVRAHHGSIWVESDPGRGSLFIVALPIAAPARQSTSGTKS